MKFTLVEWLVVAAIVLLVGGVVLGEFRKERVTMPAAFKAWEKQTGNENHLTYEEWRAFRKSEQPDPQVIYIQH